HVGVVGLGFHGVVDDHPAGEVGGVGALENALDHEVTVVRSRQVFDPGDALGGDEVEAGPAAVGGGRVEVGLAGTAEGGDGAALIGGELAAVGIGAGAGGADDSAADDAEGVGIGVAFQTVLGVGAPVVGGIVIPIQQHARGGVVVVAPAGPVEVVTVDPIEPVGHPIGVVFHGLALHRIVGAATVADLTDEDRVGLADGADLMLDVAFPRIHMAVVNDAVAAGLLHELMAVVEYVEELVGILQTAGQDDVVGAGGAHGFEQGLNAGARGVAVAPDFPGGAVRFVEQTEQNGGAVFVAFGGVAPEIYIL